MSKHFDEDAAYAAAHAEALGNNRQPGLWARVFSQSGGDENKAVATYISHRFEQLKQAYSEAEEAERKIKIEDTPSASKSPHSIEHAFVEEIIKNDTEVVSTFDIEKRLREEFGVKTHTRKNSNEWILRNQHGLIGTFYGKAAFKDAANAIFIGEDPSLKISETHSNEARASQYKGIYDEGGFLDPKLGLAHIFWVKNLLVTFVLLLVFTVISEIFVSQFPMMLLMAIATIYSPFLWVAIWRASYLYEGPKIWATLSRASVVLGIVNITFSLIFLLFQIGKSNDNFKDTSIVSPYADTITSELNQPAEKMDSQNVAANNDSSALSENDLRIQKSHDKSINPVNQSHQVNNSSDIEIAQRAELRENLETCLSGKYSDLCDHSKLTEKQKIDVRYAERRENEEICRSGQYAALCNHSLLTPEQKKQVAEAEWQQNREICLSGQYAALCDKNLLRNKP